MAKRTSHIAKPLAARLTDDSAPGDSVHFPAKRITTELEWSDLVLAPAVMAQVNEIQAWFKGGKELLTGSGLEKRVLPGFRVLFHGPPGTGKTLTACLLGKAHGVDVYRVDLSQVVSKYIGETEKNLAAIFDRAVGKNWILFFDEADALFGRRTQTADSHDRYASQEVAYLLQRLGDYPGLAILATNFQANLDDAVSRRFQASIYFPPPDPEQRLRLWENAFPSVVKLERRINLAEIARQYEVTGGQVVNIVRYCALQAVERSSKVIRLDDLLRGIGRELEKAGRPI